LRWSSGRSLLRLRPQRQDAELEQLRLPFARVEAGAETYEHAALVTSLDEPILGLGQLYRDRADCENVFDELKNQWGWGGFTTQDLARCRLAARIVALAYNWWSLFVRLAEPEQHLEAVTSRPLLLTAIASWRSHASRGRASATPARPSCASPPAPERRRGRRALSPGLPAFSQA
jgi:hypothetical protein